MRDAGVSKQALKVCLRQGGEISVNQCEQRDQHNQALRFRENHERLQNTQYEIVSSRRVGEKSQIVCIRHLAGLSSMDLYTHLKKRNIVTAPRGDRLRISPHFYNTVEEMDELVKALPR